MGSSSKQKPGLGVAANRPEPSLWPKHMFGRYIYYTTATLVKEATKSYPTTYAILFSCSARRTAETSDEEGRAALLALPLVAALGFSLSSASPAHTNHTVPTYSLPCIHVYSRGRWGLAVQCCSPPPCPSRGPCHTAQHSCETSCTCVAHPRSCCRHHCWTPALSRLCPQPGCGWPVPSGLACGGRLWWAGQPPLPCVGLVALPAGHRRHS